MEVLSTYLLTAVWVAVRPKSLFSLLYPRMFGRYSRGKKTGAQWRSCLGGGKSGLSLVNTYDLILVSHWLI